MENKRRKLLAVLFLLFCLLGIAALYGQARQPAEGTGGHSSNRQKVTLIAKSTESAFWKSVFAGASAAGTEYNMELLCILNTLIECSVFCTIIIKSKNQIGV